MVRNLAASSPLIQISMVIALLAIYWTFGLNAVYVVRATVGGLRGVKRFLGRLMGKDSAVAWVVGALGCGMNKSGLATKGASL